MKVITIGRSSECSVVINDVKVSRVHAQLVQDDNGNISVVDLGSTNGTKVNGKRITGEMRLNPGDELRVGDTMLPWQNYIATVPAQSFQPIASNTQSLATAVGEDVVSIPAGQPGKNKNTLLWIILAVVLGLLITGGVVWLLFAQGSNTPTAIPLSTDSASIIQDSVQPNDDVTVKADNEYVAALEQELDKKEKELDKKEKDNKNLVDSLNRVNAKQDSKVEGNGTKPATAATQTHTDTDEDLNKQFEQLVNKGYPQKISLIYAEVIAPGPNRLNQSQQKKAILEKFKKLKPDQKRSAIACVKDIVK